MDGAAVMGAGSQESKGMGDAKGYVPEGAVAPGMNSAWLALSRFRRRQFPSAAELCTKELRANPMDEAMWFLKTRALTMSVFIDDTDVEQEAIGDVLLDSHAMAAAPRPGTSLRRPLTNAQGGGGLLRPPSQSGRPVTGFARPGTQAGRPGTRTGKNELEAAMRTSGRPGSSRPVSVAGRYLRPGTASLITGSSDQFIQMDRLNLASFVKRPALAKALMDYIVYHEHNPRRALDLASLATEASGFSDWWWKQRLGKAYYLVGMMREAEAQFKSALKQQESIGASLELAKVYYRLDQPNAALAVYAQSLVTLGDPVFAVGTARVHEALGDLARSTSIYQQVLQMDQSNVEAIACLAANYFYSDQPEIALRFYRRLVQVGVSNAEIWNNLGLCCFFSSQYDMALGCFERALTVADTQTASDVWYNIGQVAIGLGDLSLAQHALRIAISIDANNAEAQCNLAVLELRKGNAETARALFSSAARSAPSLFEPWFNLALLHRQAGRLQDAFTCVERALEAHPDHSASKQLREQLVATFMEL